MGELGDDLLEDIHEHEEDIQEVLVNDLPEPALEEINNEPLDLPTNEINVIDRFESQLHQQQFFVDTATKFGKSNFLVPGKNEINRRVSCLLHQLFRDELYGDLCWKKGSKI